MHDQANGSGGVGPLSFEEDRSVRTPRPTPKAQTLPRDWVAVAAGAAILTIVWGILLGQFLNLTAEPDGAEESLLSATQNRVQIASSLQVVPPGYPPISESQPENDSESIHVESLAGEGEGEPVTFRDTLSEVASGDSVPQVAIIMDDLGYGGPAFESLLQLQMPLTVAVIPLLPNSEDCGIRAFEAHFEVLLHLPMETEEPVAPTPGRILTTMSEQEMRISFQESFSSVPNISGVNNHQGSQMTADPEAMERIMIQIKRYGLFFLDSRTTPRSVAGKIAREMGVPTASNNLFLDNEKDFDYICDKLETLIWKARRRGRAIGICHIHPETIRALEAMLPFFAEEEVDLVYASQMIEGAPWTEEMEEDEYGNGLIVTNLGEE